MPVVSTQNVEHYHWGDDCDGWHLLKSESLSIIEERVPPGASEQRHLHLKAQQFFYILSGVATIEIAGQRHRVRAGSGIHVPPETPHQLLNESSQELRFLVISEPKSHGDRVSA